MNITVFWEVEPCDLLHGYQISQNSTVYLKDTAVSDPEYEVSSVDDVHYITSCDTLFSTESSE